MSNRGTGATREGEGYTARNGFAPNNKLPAGRRLTLKRLKPYTSPEIIALLFGNTPGHWHRSRKEKLRLNFLRAL